MSMLVGPTFCVENLMWHSSVCSGIGDWDLLSTSYSSVAGNRRLINTITLAGQVNLHARLDDPPYTVGGEAQRLFSFRYLLLQLSSFPDPTRRSLISEIFRSWLLSNSFRISRLSERETFLRKPHSSTLRELTFPIMLSVFRILQGVKH
jgi:hypothetical protein